MRIHSLAIFTLLSLVISKPAAIAQLNLSGEANLEALLELGQQQIDAGKELTPGQQAQFDDMKAVVTQAGLQGVRLVITGDIETPDVAVGLIGNPETLHNALEDPESPLAEILQRDPEGTGNDYILKIPEQAGELPDSVALTMTRGEDMLYFAERGKDGHAILEGDSGASILPGDHDRMWKFQTAVPENVKGSIMSAIQEVMAAAQSSGNPEIGQAMMFMGMAMPIIDDLSLALTGIDAIALGFVIAPDGNQVLDFAQRRRDAATAASLQASLSEGSYQPEGIVSVLHAITSAPGVETRHVDQEDILFSRMKWSSEANDAIGQALMGSGMLYFQQIMGGAGASLPGN